MLTPIEPPPADSTAESTRPVNWQDFREHLATADKQGNRRWIYPKQPSGKFYRARTYVSWVLLAVMFADPFIRIDGNPLLMFNIVERRFSVLGQIFWPQDSVVFAVAMLLFFTGIIVFSTAFGRLWCGWACPQTLLMEMLFRKIEYAIEGDGRQQITLDMQPWTLSKSFKKVAKHSIFFGLSFLIGNTLLSYIIGVERLFEIITDHPSNHIQGLTFMVLFTLLFYGIFARFREQACTFICPYGRFQSAILDENTIVVAYDHRRGEPRETKNHTNPTVPNAPSIPKPNGDCIDCHRCVSVCPTGIDIRNGTQMECVNCTACIDACDDVMSRLQRATGLIRYASLNGIEKGEPFRVTTRMMGYAVILAALSVVLFILVFGRSDVETTLLRIPGSLFQIQPSGRISNLYTLQVANKTNRDLPIELRLEEPPGIIQIMSGKLVVNAQKLAESSVLIELDKTNLLGSSTLIRFGVYSQNRLLENLTTRFLGPRIDNP